MAAEDCPSSIKFDFDPAVIQKLESTTIDNDGECNKIFEGDLLFDTSTMYSEVEQGVRFLLQYMYDKIPRRKVALFGEQLANFLLVKFNGRWDKSRPDKDAAYRRLMVNCDGHSDPILNAAAAFVGLQPVDVLHALPDHLEMFINPGDVCYRLGKDGVSCPVPMLDRLAGGGSTTRRRNGRMTAGGGDVAAGGAGGGGNPQLTPAISPLKLVLVQPYSADGKSASGPPVFEMRSSFDVQLTAGSFAKTRFGMLKPKTEPVRSTLPYLSYSNNNTSTAMFGGACDPSQLEAATVGSGRFVDDGVPHLSLGANAPRPLMGVQHK